MDNLILFIIVLFIFCAIAILGVAFLQRYSNIRRRERIVLDTSIKIKKLKELNSQYIFSPVKRQYVLNNRVSSLRYFNSYIRNGMLMSAIQYNWAEITSIVERVQNNRLNKVKYDEQWEEIQKGSVCLDDICTLIPGNEYVAIEKKLLKKLHLSPAISTLISINVSYSSPAGRNHYNRKQIVSYDNLYQLYRQTLEQTQASSLKQAQYQAERAKMSPSLRYNILRRDGFRCQLCGATAQDGAKLHVDHIIPISKGGKTEWNNLRTLCDRCNIGKSNKLE